MLDRGSEILSFLEERATDLNNGTANLNVGLALTKLGESGWFGHAIPESLGGRGGSLLQAVEAISAVSQCCLTTGFVFWCQRVFIQYLAASNNTYLQNKILPAVLKGEIAGATGLSNAMKYLGGIEELRLQAKIEGENVTVNGFLPWASNLDSKGEFIVAVAAQTRSGQTLILALPSFAEGLKRGEDLQLLGLQASRTSTLEFDRVQLSHDWIISLEAAKFLPSVRPCFLLLQCGLALGITRKSLGETEKSLGGKAAVASDRYFFARERLTRLEKTIEQFSTLESFDLGRTRQLFTLRVDITRLAVESVGLEAEIKGGKGYFRNSDTARRLREVAFLPVLTPSLIQLETELQRQASTDKILPGELERAGVRE